MYSELGKIDQVQDGDIYGRLINGFNEPLRVTYCGRLLILKGEEVRQHADFINIFPFC